jgi:hypothetical protein
MDSAAYLAGEPSARTLDDLRQLVIEGLVEKLAKNSKVCSVSLGGIPQQSYRI